MEDIFQRQIHSERDWASLEGDDWLWLEEYKWRLSVNFGELFPQLEKSH